MVNAFLLDSYFNNVKLRKPRNRYFSFSCKKLTIHLNIFYSPLVNSNHMYPQGKPMKCLPK